MLSTSTNGNSMVPRNGEILGGQEIPSEILETILASLPLQEVVAATEVCKLWLNVIRDPIFWKAYYKSDSHYNWNQIHEHVNGSCDEWAVHFSVCKFNSFGRNLLANPFGTEKLSGWRIVSGDHRMSEEEFDNEDVSLENMIFAKPGWIVKNIDDGVMIDNFPNGLGPRTCFATDDFSCSKEQRCDLWTRGFTPAVLRACVPFTINWGSYVGTLPGHEAFHEMQIRLLNKTVGDLLVSNQDKMTHATQLGAGSPFRRLGGSYTISDAREVHEIINSQLRFIYFYHGGMAKDNLPGYNGPHIYMPSVTIMLHQNQN